ncbi:MAG: aspartate/glutamate racemase family protein [Pseudomonadales bacterium]|nr:aspartate/glutamate racemase family protein [Pseudomonadales bacterium]
MKTIGLLGGMSWESSAEYYRALNEGVRAALGTLHSAPIVMYSVDFAPIEKLQHAGDWDSTGRILAQAAARVELAGADFLLLCTNTMHKVAPQIEQAIDIPLLHIADATAEVLLDAGISTVGLLGTGFTMEQDFYKGRLSEKFGLTVITPDAADRALVHRVIYQELCLGTLVDSSRADYLRIIQQLADAGAQGVILGCTEIGMLVKQSDTDVKLFDTTAIHASKAVQFALSGAGDGSASEPSSKDVDFTGKLPQ